MVLRVFSTTTVEGIAYYLGDDTGIKHTFTDTTLLTDRGITML